MKVTRQREGGRQAKATVSARLLNQHAQRRPIRSEAGNGEFMTLPESWLDRTRLGFPRGQTRGDSARPLRGARQPVLAVLQRKSRRRPERAEPGVL